MKQINTHFFVILVVSFFYSCKPESKEKKAESRTNKFTADFIQKMGEIIPKDTARFMILVDYFKVLNAHTEGNAALRKSKDSVNFDYWEQDYFITKKSLDSLVNIIDSMDSDGFLVVKFGMIKYKVKGINYYSSLNISLSGLDNNGRDLVNFTPFVIGNNVADIKNYENIIKILNREKVFGYSKKGHNGTAYPIKKVKELLSRFGNNTSTFYFYPSSNLDYGNGLFTTLILSNIGNLRTNTSPSSKLTEFFADKGQSCCPPGN